MNAQRVDSEDSLRYVQLEVSPNSRESGQEEMQM